LRERVGLQSSLILADLMIGHHFSISALSATNRHADHDVQARRRLRKMPRALE
jgi:hypothetical protein